MKKKLLILLAACCFSISAFAQPSVGQIGIPVWTANGTSTVWMTPQNNKVIGVNGSGNLELVAGGGSSTLGALTDVSLTSLTSGQLLRYNGSGWVNWTPDYLSTSTAASTYHPLTSTSTGGNGTADSGKLMTFNSTGGLSLGSSSNNGGATGLTIYSGTANGLLVESNGVGAQAIDVQLNGTSAQAYSIHAAASYAVGVIYDGSGDNGTGIGARLSTNGAGLLVCNVDDNDKFGIQGSTGNLEWYGSATTPFSGTNKTVLAAATPSGTHTITVPNDETGNVVTTGGTGTVSATMLANTAVTPGTYTNMTGTVDADGRLTAASSGSSGITIGTTTINGTAGRVLYTDGANVQAYTITGTGSVMMSASPTSTGTATFGTVATNTIIGVTQPTTTMSVGGNSYYPYGTEFGSFAGHVLTIGKNLGTSSSCGILMRSDYGFYFSSGTNPAISAVDVGIERSAAGALKSVSGPGGSLRDLSLRNLTHTEYIEGTEMTAPSAPAANKARIYVEDSGGKTRLMVIFPSGAAQQIAIEP